METSFMEDDVKNEEAYDGTQPPNAKSSSRQFKGLFAGPDDMGIALRRKKGTRNRESKKERQRRDRRLAGATNVDPTEDLSKCVSEASACLKEVCDEFERDLKDAQTELERGLQDKFDDIDSIGMDIDSIDSISI